MKISPVGAELFHADGRTDMTKLTVAFRNFANAPKTYAFGLRLCVGVFCVDLSTNSDYSRTQHQRTALSNRDVLCLLRGTDCFNITEVNLSSQRVNTAEGSCIKILTSKPV